jgi:hypothetical protein
VSVLYAVHVLLLVTFSFRESGGDCVLQVAAVCECTIAGAFCEGDVVGFYFLLLCNFFLTFGTVMGCDRCIHPPRGAPKMML